MEPLSGHLAAFETELSGLETLVAAHEDRVIAARDDAAIEAEEADYATASSGRHGAMRHHMEGMSGCSHEGRAPGTETMHNELQEMAAEIATHRQAMAGTTSMFDSRAEEDRHQKVMRALHESLRREHDRVGTEAAGFMCPMSGGGGHGAGHGG